MVIRPPWIVTAAMCVLTRTVPSVGEVVLFSFEMGDKIGSNTSYMNEWLSQRGGME